MCFELLGQQIAFSDFYGISRSTMYNAALRSARNANVEVTNNFRARENKNRECSTTFTTKNLRPCILASFYSPRARSQSSRFWEGGKDIFRGGRFLFINFLRTQQNLGERQKFGGTAPECVTTGLHTTPFQFGTAIKKLRMTCCGDSERGEASGAPRSAMGVDEDCSVPPDSVPREVISQIGLSFNALLQRHQSQVCIFLLPQGNWELMTVASTPLNYFLGKITKTFAFAGEG